jgi:hypothetical protein
MELRPAVPHAARYQRPEEKPRRPRQGLYRGYHYRNKVLLVSGAMTPHIVTQRFCRPKGLKPPKEPGFALTIGPWLSARVRVPSTHAPTSKNPRTDTKTDIKSELRSLPQESPEPEPYQPSHDEQRDKQKRPLLVGLLRGHRIPL